jgi:EAL and modified HD-GYP domain-containing signal transduction protein
MEVFVARQPIFDVRDRVVGYELLHRAGPSNRYTGFDPAISTGQLLSENMLSYDTWHQLTGGRRAWVNFPAQLLLDGTATLVTHEHIVIELLEDIAANDEVVAACKDLADQGYMLAADDVTTPDDTNPLLEIVHVVKVDFRATTPEQRLGLAKRFAGRVHLLAEKVETRAEHAEAVTLGYELMQGYFLREPAMVSQRRVDRTRIGALSVMRAVQKHPMDFADVEVAIKREVAITDKLLRYLNSVVFGWRSRVTTIRQALIALGEMQVRRWVSVVVVSEMAADRPDELMVSTLMRARLCEQLAPALHMQSMAFDLFLTGMYSQMHLLLGTDRETMLEEAPVPDVVGRALLHETGPLWSALRLVISWESGDWEAVTAHAEALGIEQDELPSSYARALEFADSSREDAPPLRDSAVRATVWTPSPGHSAVVTGAAPPR